MTASLESPPLSGPSEWRLGIRQCVFNIQYDVVTSVQWRIFLVTAAWRVGEA